MTFKKNPDGSYDFPFPLTTDAQFAVYSAADTGESVPLSYSVPSKHV